MAENRWIARAVADAKLSSIKQMAMLSAKTANAVSLAWGLPSFRTPEPIRAAVTRGLAQDPDIGKYALPNGLPELRELVAAHHLQQTGVAVDPELNVFITAGNMQGMSSLFQALLDPGDEVILTDPGFASHIQQIRLRRGKPVHWPLDEAGGWQLDLAALPALVTDRTKVIVLVNPSNPTGTVFREKDLRALADFAMAQGILILIDDPYSHVLHDRNAPFFNLAAESRFFDQMAYLFTFSKIHAMSGWRLGYMILPDWLRTQVLKVHDATLICAPRISQMAGIAALKNHDHVEMFRSVLTARRDLICERLDRLPHVFDYVKPEGAYYVFPRIKATVENAMTFSMDLLQQAGVAVTPGDAFGPGGEHHVRMAFCVDDAAINEAFDRMENHFPGHLQA